jgi:ketosteroid isomerase-like protein
MLRGRYGSWGGPYMRKSFTIRAVLGCILFASSAVAQNSPSESAVQERLLVLEHMWNEAQVNHDWHALERLISERFINTEYDGEVSDRDKFLADIKDPQFKPSMLAIRDVRVNIFHDTAIVTGVYHTKGTYDSKPYEHLGRFTDTWVFEGGRWMCVASHTSLLKK